MALDSLEAPSSISSWLRAHRRFASSTTLSAAVGAISSLRTARGNVKVIDGDIRNAFWSSKITEGVDYVFHQAALRITRCAEAPGEAVEVLINGTLNVLEAALKHKVKKVVAASSASVYGEPSYLPIDEVPSVQQPDNVRGRQDRKRADPASASRHIRPVTTSRSVLSMCTVRGWTRRARTPKC